uniref:ribonucleoside-diphosphate reductase n=1 Tax=viral metagenome TaxID=1070528 RepID=A0A6C0LCK5_9ZZZZ
MRVIKRNGVECDVEFDEITRKIKTLAEKQPKLDIDSAKLAMEVISLIFDGITTSVLDEFTASTSASMSLYNPDYEELASRLIINNHHKNTSDSFCETMQTLNHYISYDILKICENNKSKIDSLIDYSRDYLISYFGFNTLIKSYLLKVNKKTVERPQHLFMRVAIGIHGDLNFDENCIKKIKNTYDLLSTKYFTHATPTLFNAGTKYPQMSSCYLIGTEDSVDSIYKTISDVALISKWAGGVGVHVSNIRASGSLISKTNGESQGIMPMLKVYNDTARYINQSSKRNGSFAIYLEPWHADIFTFLEAKKNNGAEELRARDLFYALWVPNIFMKRVKEQGKWSLMCPKECPGLTECYGEEFDKLYEKYESEGKYRKQIDIIELWNAIINSQIETGTPYMCYKDQVNYKSNQKNIGIIKSSNLCVEVNLFSDSKETAVCNLASICLSKFVEYKTSSFIVYSKDNCKYCDLAKKLLSHNNLGYSQVLLNNESERLDFYERHTDDEEGVLVNTMPQIFENDNGNNKRIGGYTDLVKYLEDNKHFNFEKLGEVTETIVENLDIVIDKNYYPTNESKTSNMKHRPIGIGVQGLADAFMLMNLSFTCDGAKKLNNDIFETIYYHALKKSCQLAKKKGIYETFSGSPASKGILQFDLWNKVPERFSLEKWNFLKQEIQECGLRNSTLIALMPTASTAQIMGNNESFEPYTSNMYTRRVLAGEFLLINKHLIRYLKNNNLFSREIIDSIILQKGSVQGLNISKEAKEIFKTVWEISQKSLLKMSADRSPYICQSQSFNVFIEKADPKIINSVHLYGYSLGLKTGSYYIRTKPALSTQNFSMDYLKETKHNLERNKNKNQNDSYEPCLSCSS